MRGHVIVNGRTASTERPAGATFLAELLKSAATTPTLLRGTRLSAMAGQADNVIIAAAFGVTHKTAAYYRDETVSAARPGRQ